MKNMKCFFIIQAHDSTYQQVSKRTQATGRNKLRAGRQARTADVTPPKLNEVNQYTACYLASSLPGPIKHFISA